MKLDLGTVPAWISAAATVLGFGWGIVLLTIESRRRRSKYAIAVTMWFDRSADKQLHVANFGLMPVSRIRLYAHDVELGGAPSILPGEQHFAISVKDPEHFDESQVVLEFVDARQKGWRREFSGKLQLHRA